jgi:hypothetical protein
MHVHGFAHGFPMDGIHFWNLLEIRWNQGQMFPSYKVA